MKKLAMVALVLSVLSVACKKEPPVPAVTPTPMPSPTVAVTPRPTPAPGVAVCFIAMPIGTPPICKDGYGTQVVCPPDAERVQLPFCGD